MKTEFSENALDQCGQPITDLADTVMEPAANRIGWFHRDTGNKILLLPACPKEWDVNFKLHAEMQTTIEGVYRGGKLESLTVTPPERTKDVVNCLDKK